MKTKLLSLAFLFVAITFSSCNHDDDDPIVLPVAPAAADGFTWTENGGSTVHTAATASFSTQYKTMLTQDASNNPLFEINLNGTTAATYPIGTDNHLTYVTNPYFAATGGSIIVTSNSGGKISGTFHATGNAAGITVVDGTFQNITVVP